MEDNIAEKTASDVAMMLYNTTIPAFLFGLYNLENIQLFLKAGSWRQGVGAAKENALCGFFLPSFHDHDNLEHPDHQNAVQAQEEGRACKLSHQDLSQPEENEVKKTMSQMEGHNGTHQEEMVGTASPPHWGEVPENVQVHNWEQKSHVSCVLGDPEKRHKDPKLPKLAAPAQAQEQQQVDRAGRGEDVDKPVAEGQEHLGQAGHEPDQGPDDLDGRVGTVFLSKQNERAVTIPRKYVYAPEKLSRLSMFNFNIGGEWFKLSKKPKIATLGHHPQEGHGNLEQFCAVMKTNHTVENNDCRLFRQHYLHHRALKNSQHLPQGDCRTNCKAAPIQDREEHLRSTEIYPNPRKKTLTK